MDDEIKNPNETAKMLREIDTARGTFFGNKSLQNAPPPQPESKPQGNMGRIKPVATRRPPPTEPDKSAYPGDPVKSAIANAMDKFL